MTKIISFLSIAVMLFAAAISYSANNDTVNDCCCTNCTMESCECSALGCCENGSCAGDCKCEGCKSHSSASCCEEGTGSSMTGHTENCCKQEGDNTAQANNSDKVICPVSKEEFAKGKGIAFKYLGKEYEMCCDGCVLEFKAEPMNFISEQIECPVMKGEAASKELFTVVDGVKYYFCCEGCDKKFTKNPDKYLK